MATKIIRYSNRHSFEIEYGKVDFSTDKVVVEDYAVANPTEVYCTLDDKNSYAYRHELVSKPISEGKYHEFLMECYTPTFYRFGNNEKAKLLTEGICTATDGHGGKAKVFVGLKIVPFLEEKGAESLAKCYEQIAKMRKQETDRQSEIDALLAIGANADKAAEPAENIVEDIKWFLDHRNEIKAKCK